MILSILQTVLLLLMCLKILHMVYRYSQSVTRLNCLLFKITDVFSLHSNEEAVSIIVDNCTVPNITIMHASPAQEDSVRKLCTPWLCWLK